jgi:hypothetical protein
MEGAPDHEIEQFWLAFKQSMVNFYGLKDCMVLRRPIQKWSDQLNLLQSQRRYAEIEEAIMQYISLYAMDLLKVCNFYYINILETNIKRWNKIASKFKCEFGEKDKSEKGYYNCVFMLLDICYLLLKNGNPDVIDLFSQYELCVLYHDYSHLIQYAVKHNKVGMLDKLLNYDYYGTISVLGVESSGEKYGAKKLLAKN